MVSSPARIRAGHLAHAMWPALLNTPYLCSTALWFTVWEVTACPRSSTGLWESWLWHSLCGLEPSTFANTLLRLGQRPRGLGLRQEGAAAVDFHGTPAEWAGCPAGAQPQRGWLWRVIGAFASVVTLSGCSFWCLVIMFLQFWVDMLFVFLAAYVPTFFGVFQYTTKYRCS